MSKLPKWLEESRPAPVTSLLHDRHRLIEALSIAWEALYKARMVIVCKEAMRRIEEMNK